MAYAFLVMFEMFPVSELFGGEFQHATKPQPPPKKKVEKIRSPKVFPRVPYVILMSGW